jgi:hypothetical protein
MAAPASPSKTPVKSLLDKHVQSKLTAAGERKERCVALRGGWRTRVRCVAGPRGLSSEARLLLGASRSCCAVLDRGAPRLSPTAPRRKRARSAPLARGFLRVAGPDAARRVRVPE